MRSFVPFTAIGEQLTPASSSTNPRRSSSARNHCAQSGSTGKPKRDRQAVQHEVRRIVIEDGAPRSLFAPKVVSNRVFDTRIRMPHRHSSGQLAETMWSRTRSSPSVPTVSSPAPDLKLEPFMSGCRDGANLDVSSKDGGEVYGGCRSRGFRMLGYELVQMHGDVGDRVTVLFHRTSASPSCGARSTSSPSFPLAFRIAARSASRRKAASASARIAAALGSPWLPGSSVFPTLSTTFTTPKGQ